MRTFEWAFDFYSVERPPPPKIMAILRGPSFEDLVAAAISRKRCSSLTFSIYAPLVFGDDPRLVRFRIAGIENASCGEWGCSRRHGRPAWYISGWIDADQFFVEGLYDPGSGLGWLRKARRRPYA